MLATSCNVWTLMNFAYLWMQFRSSEIICANSKGISLHHCLRGGAKRLLPPVPLMCLDTGNRRQKKKNGSCWVLPESANLQKFRFWCLSGWMQLLGWLATFAAFNSLKWSFLPIMVSLLWPHFCGCCIFYACFSGMLRHNVVVMLMSSIGKTVTRTAKKEEYAYKILQTRFCMVLWGERLARSCAETFFAPLTQPSHGKR